MLRDILLAPKVPRQLQARFIEIDSDQLSEIRESLRNNYFSANAPEYLSTAEGRGDMEAHLTGRLNWDRQNVIPWLDHVRKLSGSTILEIGCGTGASTVALAEQGAHVTAVDIDDLALKDAAFRCSQYGVAADLANANATTLPEIFSGRQFDIVIFYASLEHMTYDERTRAIASAWALLPADGLLCVVDTPNRLAFFDDHTALLPFFHWLPDEIAMQYSKYSSRENFNTAFGKAGDVAHESFMRWGRGISFHEFHLALGDVKLDSATCLSAFQRKQRWLKWLKWRLSKNYRFQKLLKEIEPRIPDAFYESGLNLIIKKSPG